MQFLPQQTVANKLSTSTSFVALCISFYPYTTTNQKNNVMLFLLQKVILVCKRKKTKHKKDLLQAFPRPTTTTGGSRHTTTCSSSWILAYVPPFSAHLSRHIMCLSNSRIRAPRPIFLFQTCPSFPASSLLLSLSL